MQLTRRDAIAALAALGIGGSVTAYRAGVLDTAPPEDETILQLLAVSKAVYPSEVSATSEFISIYSLGRVQSREGYVEGIESSLAALDRHARRSRGVPLTDLSGADIDTLLRELGVDRVHPTPDGSTGAQIRHFVVDELLYALYSTPVGGTLVGIDNPPGFPGGLSSYYTPPSGDEGSAEEGG